MASELENRIVGILEQAKNEIVSNIQNAGISASGRTEKSISVVVRPGSIALVKLAGNNAPIETLEIGRPSGKVPAGFNEIILQWMKDKGITTGDDREDKTKAYFISKKIANEGTGRNANPRNDIYSNVVQKTVEKLAKVIGEEFIKSIKTN